MSALRMDDAGTTEGRTANAPATPAAGGIGRVPMVPVLIWLAFLTDSLQWTGPGGGPDVRGIYLVVLATLAIAVARHRLPVARELIAVILFLALWSVPGLLYSPVAATTAVAQLVGAGTIAAAAYYLVISIRSLDNLARLYSRIMLVLAGAVILDQLLFMIGGGRLASLVFGQLPARNVEAYIMGSIYRASGLLYEPSQVGLLIAPAVCFWLLSGRRWHVVAGILAIVSSQSALGLVGIAIALVLSGRNAFKKIALIVLVAALAIPAISQISVLKSRVLPLAYVTNRAIQGDEVSAQVLSRTGGTTATLAANFAISVNGALQSPLFGWGVGSFRVHYGENLERIFPDAYGLPGFYNPSGASLLLRMLFELGFVGTLVVLTAYYLRSRKARRHRDSRYVRIWVTTALCFFVITLLRKEAIVSFYLWFYFAIFIVCTRSNPIPDHTRQTLEE